MAKRPKTVPVPGRLGRGLSSLIGGASRLATAATSAPAPPPPSPPPGPEDHDPRADADGRPLTIPVDAIAPNPHQPRRRFDEADLASLRDSISQQGVLQPLLVVRSSAPDAATPYVLIAGERRLRAARDAGLPEVPCVLKDATERQMLEWSLIENIQRADLNAVERAEAYRGYMDRFDLTQAQVAERTGDSRATVANYLRVLDLSDPVQEMLLAGALTFGHARALAGLAGRAPEQERLARRVVSDGLSVRQTEDLVAKRSARPRSDAATRAPDKPRPAYVADLERRLTEAVGTRVRVQPGRGRNRGRIVLEYYSLDDFDRIAACLGVTGED